MNTQATHTPGPWRYCAITEKIWAADGQEDIGMIAPGPDLAEWEPNGRLMAAAPDLLEALQFICNGIGGGGDAPEAVLIKWKRRADDAIAKAEGRAD
jgi:hypothetical protein